ncbi:DUF3822 family protein [Botryobacter ruber]|uniref:DUF3822 family protein n=1 Tax=Botryobacter ruber TaxID=2171629 RepID=UPI000E0BA3CF|nr:DUF3822 family protein [Botryobacter ruber]
MNHISTQFRLAHRINDEAFQLSQAMSCNLYIAIGHKFIRLGVADLERNKFVVLEDYELITVFTPEQVAEQLQLIAKCTRLLQERHWQEIRVSVSNTHFTLVPETLFVPEHQTDYLRLHSDLDSQQDVVLSYKQTGLEAVNIFSVHRAIYDTFQQLFPERPVRFLHQTSALIRSELHLARRLTEQRMYLFVEQNYVTVLVIGRRGLEFCNIFHYLSPEDFIYYIVFVMQEQRMNPEQETITVWGDITHDSALFSILQKYIRQVRLGKKPADVGYSYRFNDLFEHRYFELYSLHLCE